MLRLFVLRRENKVRVGLDIGSTTIKCVVLGEHDELLYSTYERHYSHILEKAQELLRRIDAEQLHGCKALLSRYGLSGQLWRALCAGGVLHPRGGQALYAKD